MDVMYQKTNLRVCSKHFIIGKPSKPTDEKSQDWAPSLYLKDDSDTDDADEDADVPLEPELDMWDPEHGHPFGDADYFEDEPQVCHESQRVEEITNESENPRALDFDTSACSNNDDRDMPGNKDCVPEPSVERNILNDSFAADFGVGESIVNSTCVGECETEEYDSLVSKYDNLVRTREELLEVIAEKELLAKSHGQLRDQLTNAEVDTLELSDSLAKAEEKLNECMQKCRDLEVEVDSADGIKKDLVARINLLKEAAKTSNDKIPYLEEQLAKAKKCILRYETLKGDDKLVKYYTGLPSFTVLEGLLKLILAHVDDATRCLEPGDCVLLTLMRLRLGLHLTDLAHRFSISTPSAGYVFEKWLYYLYVYLKKRCIIWPDREKLYKTMPNSFKAAFGCSVAVIIDCFELFIEKPSSLDTRAMTWSQYKHHNTLKYLIGINPLGLVCFISHGWGGRVSDRHITAKSGLYEKLLPNDVILADRGFTISEDVGFYCAKVLYPAFTKGKPQLSLHDITDTRKLASLRVHVERVNGLVKNRFRILKSTLSLEFMCKKRGHDVAQIDEVVTVCCALANLGAGIV